jgi:hypothetical protein
MINDQRSTTKFENDPRRFCHHHATFRGASGASFIHRNLDFADNTLYTNLVHFRSSSTVRRKRKACLSSVVLTQ